jgi:hypothetical protein
MLDVLSDRTVFQILLFLFEVFYLLSCNALSNLLPNLRKPCYNFDRVGTMFAETYVVGDDGFFFADVAASKMAVTKSHWKSPAEDDTIPMFVDEEKNYVAQIVAAFQALEKTPNARYCRRFIEGYYGDWQLEAKAWEIVVSLLDIRYLVVL